MKINGIHLCYLSNLNLLSKFLAMKKQLLLLIIFFSCFYLHAQDTTIIVKAGNRINDVLAPANVLLYPHFNNGIVSFRDGSKAAAKMNYNSLYDQMLFINPKGDTLAITDEKNIKYVALSSDTFYYHEGYIKLVANTGNIKLAEKRIWEIADIRKMGAHNKEVNTYAVTTVRTITDGVGRTYDLTLPEDLVLRKKSVYYLGDRLGLFVPADRKNLNHHFPKEAINLTNYLKENKVDLKNKSDLVKLINFMDQSAR
ncbi:MAG: hypothetical protein JWP88_1210 [Flaviaesturariibacter sp.]|nr:hypothetical protein [Flaviaesturariibacter sp.]